MQKDQLGIQVLMPSIDPAVEDGIGDAYVVAHAFDAIAIDLDIVRHPLLIGEPVALAKPQIDNLPARIEPITAFRQRL